MNLRIKYVAVAFAFLLTGVGTALLGATLPAILRDLHLNDAQGGLLLLAAWGGATAGAYTGRRGSVRTAALGLVLSATSLLALALGTGLAPTLLYFAYGLGLGTTMTAISVLRARAVDAAGADLEMNRLNLVWAVGACTAPVLALHSLRLLSVVALYRSVACLFGLSAVSLFLLSRSAETRSATEDLAAKADRHLPWAPLSLGLFAAASVGLESAIGSWLTTYAERATLGEVSTAVSANSAFWLGLLLSRALHSVPGARALHSRGGHNLHIAVVGVSTALLLLHPGAITIPCAGFLCGFGLGPLYPYVLSVALPRYRPTAVFVLAGVGASLVPWLTGALSSALGSLRWGLLVPLAACLVLAGTGLRTTRSSG